MNFFVDARCRSGGRSAVADDALLAHERSSLPVYATGFCQAWITGCSPMSRLSPRSFRTITISCRVERPAFRIFRMSLSSHRTSCPTYWISILEFPRQCWARTERGRPSTLRSSRSCMSRVENREWGDSTTTPPSSTLATPGSSRIACFNRSLFRPLASSLSYCVQTTTANSESSNHWTSNTSGNNFRWGHTTPTKSRP